ncbi:RanBP1 domain-containing protein [Limtongia smithiae]|uniref:RanBP1 domain-containing protein n=1 Tax=Limtongia smithiae TaxID=1125753 RepID=UPI0034CDAD7C
MSSEPAKEEVPATETTAPAAAAPTANVFSMFGGTRTTPSAPSLFASSSISTAAKDDDDESAVKAIEEEPDVQFEPVIKLTELKVTALEDNEDVIFKMRAKLFRYDGDAKEWKERGTGDLRLLQDKSTSKIRILMRRDKTLKTCANHLITSEMKLQPNIGSDRSWVYTVAADYSESVPTPETLAVRFANAENANLFKEKFEEAQAHNKGLASKAETAEPAKDEKEK